MPLEIIIPIAAVVILLLLFTWLIRVFKVTIKTVLIVVAILTLLQIIFGINSQEVIQEMVSIAEALKDYLMQNINLFRKDMNLNYSNIISKAVLKTRG